MGYSVWLQDLNNVVDALSRKVHISCFTTIRGNCYGDFIIETDNDTTYLVKHDDWSVWKCVEGKRTAGLISRHWHWEEVK